VTSWEVWFGGAKSRQYFVIWGGWLYLDSWVLDLGASFHTTVIFEILENYVAGDFKKVYLADGSALDIVDMSNVRIRVHNDSV
jgi:hypothetical protein